MRIHMLLALLLAWPASALPRSASRQPPLCPTGLTATGANQTAIRLSWTPPANAVGRAAVTGYKVEVSSDCEAWRLLVTIANAAGATYEDSDLPRGEIRCYRVIATSGEGDSQPSNKARAILELATTELTMRALGARVAAGAVSSNYAQSEASESEAGQSLLSRFADSSFYLAFESQSEWTTREWKELKPSLSGILNVRLTSVPVESETVMDDDEDPTTGSVESEAAMDDMDINVVPRPSTEVQIGVLFNLWKPSFQVASHSFHWALGITTRTDFQTIPGSRNHGSTGDVVLSWPAGFRLSLYRDESAVPMVAYVDYSPLLVYGSREEWWMVRPDLEARGWIGNFYVGFDITRGGNRPDHLQIVIGVTRSLGDILP